TLISSPNYWSLEATAFRIWRLQLAATPKLLPPQPDSKTEAEMEVRAARMTAETVGCELPARETLIDDKEYWEIEREAWREWEIRNRGSDTGGGKPTGS
ncbi:MAG: hypothetical protein Q9187_007131, partial [Circinaria calcarea]